MDVLSIMLLALILLWIAAALLHLIRHGSCGCGKSSCKGCGGNCKHCSK